MRLAVFKSDHQRRVGAVKGDWVVDIAASLHLLESKAVSSLRFSRWRESDQRVIAEAGSPGDVMDVIGHGRTWMSNLDEALNVLLRLLPPNEAKGILIPMSEARLCAPISRPGKIVCVGRNYVEHARERGSDIGARPVYFLKSSNTMCGPGEPILLPPNSSEVDYEAELAVVIGKSGRGIPEEKAYDHVAGYMILNDVTARDMQREDKQWFRGKSCDSFAPTGPWLVTPDEIPDPHNLRISLTLNGKTMQDSNTSKMVFKIPYLISYLSQSLTWEVGDLLSTGTPEGVGAHQKPPVFLKPGDSVSITVERIGTLTNPVVGP